MRSWSCTDTEGLFGLNRSHDILNRIMRVNLSARTIPSENLTAPKSLYSSDLPAPIPGDNTCTRDSDWLLSLLRQKTDLPFTVLESFEMGMHSSGGARRLDCLFGAMSARFHSSGSRVKSTVFCTLICTRLQPRKRHTTSTTDLSCLHESLHYFAQLRSTECYYRFDHRAGRNIVCATVS
jgi:hypothetical protein